MIGGDGFRARGKRAKSNGASGRATTWISPSAGAAWTRLTRVARPELEALVKLLGHPFGARADLVDMSGHRSAPADFEPTLLGRDATASAEQQQLAPGRPVGVEETLGGIEDAPVEGAGESLLGAQRNHQMATASGAGAGRSAAVIGERQGLADGGPDRRRIGADALDTFARLSRAGCGDAAHRADHRR